MNKRVKESEQERVEEEKKDAETLSVGMIPEYRPSAKFQENVADNPFLSCSGFATSQRFAGLTGIEVMPRPSTMSNNAHKDNEKKEDLVNANSSPTTPAQKAKNSRDLNASKTLPRVFSRVIIQYKDNLCMYAL